MLQIPKKGRLPAKSPSHKSALELFHSQSKIEIEDYLNLVSRNENDELAIALAAGRFATMKLTQLTGENETKTFVNECIITTLKK